jgi:murein L,D-transpeptidase YcbB/YkuD
MERGFGMHDRSAPALNASSPNRVNRRGFLRATTAALAGIATVGSAMAQDNLLETLMHQQSGELGGEYDAASRTVHMPKASLPTLSAGTVETTEQAIPVYEALVAKGGWPAIPVSDDLHLGAKNKSVVAMRQRLQAGGDLDVNSGLSEVYDTYVERAVRRFQVRHGLIADGVAHESTINTMNIPAETRLNQLKINVERLRTMAKSLTPRFVMSNIPAAQIEAVENGVAVTRHTAVVGKPDRASPVLNSKIVEINFNPYWTVPVSIVRKDLIPKMQAEPDYLTKNHIRVLDPHGNEVTPSQINWYSQDAVNYRFKQDPGSFNSLGTIRINFPSPYGVYMHDTPLKNLFGEDFRFHSSGCMRVQNVRELVYWLLEGVPGWSREEVDRVIESGERKDARLPKPVPLHWVYITAWATPDNVVQFRDDIYNKDGLGQLAQRG